VYRQRLYNTGWLLTDDLSLITDAKDLDQLWDCICSQIALGECTDVTTGDLDARLSLNQRIFTLEAEVAKLTERSRKERQVAKKNQLHDEARAKMRQLEKLKVGM
jgi:RNAse (barnase) inhibitor barstar